MAGPVCQGRCEGLAEHILQVISMVSLHPAGVRLDYPSHAAGLRKEVGVGACRFGVGQGQEKLLDIRYVMLGWETNWVRRACYSNNEED